MEAPAGSPSEGASGVVVAAAAVAAAASERPFPGPPPARFVSVPTPHLLGSHLRRRSVEMQRDKKTLN